MFGHNDDRSSRGNNDHAAVMPDGILTNDDNTSVASVLVGSGSTKYPPSDLPAPTSAPAAPSNDLPVVSTRNTASTPSVSPAHGGSQAAVPTGLPHPDQLLDIKQQALQHLSPLVDHLEQSPNDRFRTTMMMIQASDNAALIKSAYDAALQIKDDKERAQALLDLVNEINYFTQQNKHKDA
jgi:hypothetical protein